MPRATVWIYFLLSKKHRHKCFEPRRRERVICYFKTNLNEALCHLREVVYFLSKTMIASFISRHRGWILIGTVMFNLANVGVTTIVCRTSKKSSFSHEMLTLINSRRYVGHWSICFFTTIEFSLFINYLTYFAKISLTPSFGCVFMWLVYIVVACFIYIRRFPLTYCWNKSEEFNLSRKFLSDAILYATFAIKWQRMWYSFIIEYDNLRIEFQSIFQYIILRRFEVPQCTILGADAKIILIRFSLLTMFYHFLSVTFLFYTHKRNPHPTSNYSN